MAKFRVGDRVAVDWPAEIWCGEATVDEVFDSTNVIVQYDDGKRGGFASRHLTVIAPAITAVSSAIRTVTRREIVPGSYGVVTIFGDGAAHVSGVKPQSPSDLRAAAALFNELADVLDENAREAA